MPMIRRLLQISFAIAALALLAATPAGAVMKSTKLPDGTCATTGGGKIVPIPGYPGESIDRRLLTDIRWIQRRYPIFITDGYSADAVHAANGEHPLGLALDIVPDKAAGGTWAQITALALFAEPIQDKPAVPFRWVGYDGDEGHGRRHHLHLSWNHSVVKRSGRLARTVYTLRCPKPVTAADRARRHDADDARTAGDAGAAGRRRRPGDRRPAGSARRRHAVAETAASATAT